MFPGRRNPSGMLVRLLAQDSHQRLPLMAGRGRCTPCVLSALNGVVVPVGGGGKRNHNRRKPTASKGIHASPSKGSQRPSPGSQPARGSFRGGPRPNGSKPSSQSSRPSGASTRSGPRPSGPQPATQPSRPSSESSNGGPRHWFGEIGTNAVGSIVATVL